jgi:hypothetical protein
MVELLRLLRDEVEVRGHVYSRYTRQHTYYPKAFLVISRYFE